MGVPRSSLYQRTSRTLSPGSDVEMSQGIYTGSPATACTCVTGTATQNPTAINYNTLQNTPLHTTLSIQYPFTTRINVLRITHPINEQEFLFKKLQKSIFISYYIFTQIQFRRDKILLYILFCHLHFIKRDES